LCPTGDAIADTNNQKRIANSRDTRQVIVLVGRSGAADRPTEPALLIGFVDRYDQIKRFERSSDRLQIADQNIMDLELVDKVALITGASRGIGRAIARLLNEEGCHLALVGRRKHLLNEVAQELAKTTDRSPLVLAEDITAPGAAARIKDAVLGRFGRLDIIINNAGGSRPIENGFGTIELWDEAMRLNFDAGRNLTHAFIEGMQTQKFGRIISITGSQEPIAGLNAAMPPNGAVDVWSKALSRVVGKDGITVNCISPGIVHSEQIDERVLPTEEDQQNWARTQIPVGYIGEAEDVALAAIFLSSARARYITGEVIYVDGGAKRYAH
jgi:3-oxoacyl-[acyl-carrier protein] reductase